MEEHALRRSLSDELHARAFHEFEGAGRFIRYVFLTESGAVGILAYIDEFLIANGQQPIPEGSKFLRLDMDGFAIRVEQHAEFLSVSFIEKGHSKATGLLDDAFDAVNTALPLAWARGIPASVFHAIWLEIGGKPPRGTTPETMQAMMQSRAVASNLFSDGAAQLHFAFDIDDAGFSRIAMFNEHISPNRTGRVVQRVVERETYHAGCQVNAEGPMASDTARSAANRGQASAYPRARNIGAADRTDEGRKTATCGAGRSSFSLYRLTSRMVDEAF